MGDISELENLNESTPSYLNLKKSLNSKQNLIAVSKMQPAEKINALYESGQRHFGENYLQEALIKIQKLCDLDICWHLIGHLQKNKVKLLQKNFEYIHSIDSVELAAKISESAEKIKHVQKIFLQINLADESTKSGFLLSEFPSAFENIKQLSGVQVVGLMTMPPLENQPETNRPYFKNLAALARQNGLTELSMGTSQDYKVALEEGATWIRLGTILFGQRPKK